MHLLRSESHFTAADPRQSQFLQRQEKPHSSGENSTSLKFYDQIIAQLGVLRKLSAPHTYGDGLQVEGRGDSGSRADPLQVNAASGD